MEFQKDSEKGFTLVEMIIAMGIFAIMSGMSVSSYMKFNNKIGTDLLVHSVAQDGHLVQVESMAVKRASGSSIYPGYGLNFDLTPAASSTYYDIFADLNGNGSYGGSAVNASDRPLSCPAGGMLECEKRVYLEKGTKITRICALMSGGPAQGSCDAGYKQVDRAEISFKRPSTDANLLVYSTTGSTYYSAGISSVRIYIASSKGYERGVEFWSAGQISIK